MDQILQQRQQIIEQMLAQQSQIKADREQIRLLERRIERSESVVQLQLDNVLELTAQYNQLAQQQPAPQVEPEPIPPQVEPEPIPAPAPVQELESGLLAAAAHVEKEAQC